MARRCGPWYLTGMRLGRGQDTQRVQILVCLFAALTGWRCGGEGNSNSMDQAGTAGGEDSPTSEASGATGIAGCGDNVCSDGEDCRSCAEDCGPCPPCHAPACEDFAGSPPLGFDPFGAWNLDLSEDTTGPGAQQPSTGESTACGAPGVQIALAKVTVVDEVKDILGDRVYCAIQAESGAEYRALVTEPTEALRAGGVHEYTLAGGLVWGSSGPQDPGGNLRLTYDCFESDSTENFDNLVDELGTVAGAVAEGTGQATAEAGSGAAGAIKALLDFNEDNRLINATQTLDARFFAPSALGVSWTVTAGGDESGFGGIGQVWGWELEMHMWGCAEHGGTGSGCATDSCYEAGACVVGTCDESTSCCTF